MINYKEKIVYIPFILISLMPLSLISGPAIPDLSLVVVCIIFFIVQLILEGSGHALEVFALLTAIALFLINKLGKKNVK